jgi:SAM-dependent methyltransferase
MDYQGLEELKLIDKYLKNYNEMIVNFFIKKIDKKNFSVLDFGAGIGTLAEIFYKKTSIKPECFEICQASQKILLQKGFKLQNEFLNEEKYDLIFSSNVLEHIERDYEAVADIKKMLKQNGYLIISVPAFNFLFSEFDLKVGHFRRYNVEMLRKICDQNDLEVETIKFFDSVGFFILLFMKLLKINSHQKITAKNLIFYDRIFVKINIISDLIFRKICGKNIILIARKNALR